MNHAVLYAFIATFVLGLFAGFCTGFKMGARRMLEWLAGAGLLDPRAVEQRAELEKRTLP